MFGEIDGNGNRKSNLTQKTSHASLMIITKNMHEQMTVHPSRLLPHQTTTARVILRAKKVLLCTQLMQKIVYTLACHLRYDIFMNDAAKITFQVLKISVIILCAHIPVRFIIASGGK